MAHLLGFCPFSSRAFSQFLGQYSAGYCKQMTNPKIREIILSEIDRRGLNTAEAARLMDVPYDAVRDLRRRENQTPNADRARQMLAKLGLHVENMTETGAEYRAPRPTTPATSFIDPRGDAAPLGHNDMRVHIVEGQLIVNAAVSASAVPTLIKLIQGAAAALED